MPNTAEYKRPSSRPGRLLWEWERDYPIPAAAAYVHPLGSWGIARTVLHELTHSLGIKRHANRYTCDVRATAKLDSSNCGVEEYGSQFSVMGKGTAALNMHPSALYHMGLLHAEDLGRAMQVGPCLTPG